VLNRKTLGRTGVEVTTVGLGCAYLGSVGDDFSEDRGLQTVWAALEAGVRLIDTAPLYQSTASERLIGRALKERPDLAADVVVETKCCRLREGSDYSYDAAMRSVEGRQVCRRNGISLLAAALQYVTRHPVVAATIPGARTPAEVVANAQAANAPIPEAVWEDLRPLVQSWDVVARQ